MFLLKLKIDLWRTQTETGQRDVLCKTGEGGSPMRGSQARLHLACFGEPGGLLTPPSCGVNWGWSRNRDSRSSPRGSNMPPGLDPNAVTRETLIYLRMDSEPTLRDCLGVPTVAVSHCFRAELQEPQQESLAGTWH